jgi:Lrp/AsnC family transcriptional regulator for asnA, asnC and gidA
MDEIDILILSELLEDARKPFSTIADNIGSSTQTVKRRYQTLKKKYIILSSISIDTSKLGFTGITYLLMNIVSGTDSLDLIEPLRKMPGIIVATRTVGEFECFAIMLFRDFNDFFEKIRVIQKIPNLKELEIAVTKNVHPQWPHNVDIIGPYKDNIKKLRYCS